jgi:hypothetical protein
LYGVNDDGTISGSDVARQKFDPPLQNSVKNSIAPAAVVSLKSVSVLGKEVLVVVVSPWNRRDVYQFDEKVYLRKGTNVFAAKPEELRKLHRREYIIESQIPWGNPGPRRDVPPTGLLLAFPAQIPALAHSENGNSSKIRSPKLADRTFGHQKNPANPSPFNELLVFIQIVPRGTIFGNRALRSTFVRARLPCGESC